ncbi:uncharacterized protein RCC_08166 [Ramularia collo-cygni]|uniref:Uncharacterized protein n=1 Tax=Ramularia collo-cygni TaxID=112498 RepID=A0A2D3VBV2_9PEZI|nr:uncharacterized protein RCC_08166 [Ramularia collo-cygni]CZT22297.1 uncharacterized protein RCC_08166 [Ramularia collo-cygni]
MPCTIGSSDCVNLYETYSALLSTALPGMTKGLTFSAPPCATGANRTFSFSSARCDQGYVGIRASSVQLLYWPVRTVENFDYFCNHHSITAPVSPQTLPGTPTGSGPNTFVTGSLTITSPTIALSFSALSRYDDCGTTIDHTIITLLPEQLTSVRGARALFDWQPFNYGDLNWMCLTPDKSTYTLQNVMGPDCYQNVPAQAYWSDAVRFDRATNGQYENSKEQRAWTMMNDYQPHIIPPMSLWSETMQSIWGRSARWDIDGTWDPPIALQQEASVAKPTLPSTASATPTTFTYLTHPATVSPTPAKLGDTLPSPTEAPQPHRESTSAVPSEVVPSSATNVHGTGYAASSPPEETVVPEEEPRNSSGVHQGAAEEPEKSPQETVVPEAVPSGHSVKTDSPGAISITPLNVGTGDFIGTVILNSVTYSWKTGSSNRVILQNEYTSTWVTINDTTSTIDSQVLSTALVGMENPHPTVSAGDTSAPPADSIASGTQTTSSLDNPHRKTSRAVQLTSGTSTFFIAGLLFVVSLF